MERAPASPSLFASLTARSVAGAIDVALIVLIAALAQRLRGGRVQLPDVSFMVLSAGYFILAYSSAGNGYSLGKRLLSIRVVNRNGDPLSLVASVVRWAIVMGVGAPLSFVIVNLERNKPLGVAPAMAIAVPVLCIVVVDSYLFLFNRGTRQSLHDFAAGSFVVRRSHEGVVPVVPLWRGHYGWIAACCAAVAVFFPGPYRWTREFVPRSAELLRARERILATRKVKSFIVSPGFAAQGSDTIWYVSVMASVSAAPKTEHDAESLRLGLACALVREAPRALRSAQVYLMLSFGPGAVSSPGSAEYLADIDLTTSRCAAVPTKF
jgi:uncharacterized RDD family membrane protein YckC